MNKTVFFCKYVLSLELQCLSILHILAMSIVFLLLVFSFQCIQYMVCALSTWRSLTFSNQFILVRISVNLETVPGTLGMRQESTLNGMPVHLKAPCTRIHLHTFTLGGNLAQLNHQLACIWESGEPEKPTWTPREHLKPQVTRAQGLQCCEVGILP